MAHKQLNTSLVAPVDLLQLIEILEDSSDPGAEDWIDAIRVMRNEMVRGASADRLDLFMYVCGRQPASRATWIPRDRAHPRYARSGPLEAVDVHLTAFDEVLEHVYGARTEWSRCRRLSRSHSRPPSRHEMPQIISG